MNTFGQNFRLTIWGESHGAEVGVVVDGVPAGVALTAADFEADLARRRSGAAGTTARCEQDLPCLCSGVYNDHTTGAPLAITFVNADTRAADYAATADHCRPSHADRVAHCKADGWNDPRGGGHFSGRLTVGLVAAGVVAKKCLDPAVTFSTQLLEVGGECDAARFDEVIAEAQRAGDSVGGIVECRVTGVCVGVGEPLFDSVESLMSHLLFSIPAVKGVEFGAGFGAARVRGSQNNDRIIDGAGHTATNHDGGINGGMANGNEIVVRVAVKPTPSIACEQMTYNFANQRVEPLSLRGRHDTCIALRAAVVVEAAVAIALADLTL
ncbi:MAG: chorismate synthase [Alistipes sp.]